MLKRLVIIVVLGIFLAGSFIVSGYFYIQWKKVSKVVDSIHEEELKEVEEITSVISMFMELPQGEEPTLATVVDREKLKNQSLFISAKNGDKVLMYTNAKKAILYRPFTKKIVDSAPLYFTKEQFEQAQISTASIPEEIRTVKIAYYNGTGIAGRASVIETQIKQSFTNTETVVVSNAKAMYTTTMVVDLNGNMALEADGIAQILSGQVQVFPQGEERPDADLLIIVGE